MHTNPSQQQLEALWDVCSGFVEQQKISCQETICQCDWVILNAYDFIEEVCGVVGYHKHAEERE